MPLIIVTGRPCVGKTRFAEQLRDYLQANIPSTAKVTLINEESLRLSKHDGYANSNKEKDIRGALKSAVEHALNPNTYVILDSLNYIKGYRYELYCQARTNRSTHCVVWVAADEKTALQRNKQRKEEGVDTYDELILQELWKRYEVPNENNRWDRPLFKVAEVMSELNAETKSIEQPVQQPVASSPVSAAPTTVFKSSWKPKSKKALESSIESTVSVVVPVTPTEAENAISVASLTISGSTLESSEDHASFSKAESVFGDIFNHLSTAAVMVPNSSTVTPLHAQADMLYELDHTSQKILMSVVAHQADCAEGTPIQLTEYDRAFTLHRHVSLSELQRIRRQFVKINAQHPPSSSKEIGSSFIDFLASQL